MLESEHFTNLTAGRHPQRSTGAAKPDETIFLDRRSRPETKISSNCRRSDNGVDHVDRHPQRDLSGIPPNLPFRLEDRRGLIAPSRVWEGRLCGFSLLAHWWRPNSWKRTKPLYRPDETDVQQRPAMRRAFPTERVVHQMIEVVAIIIGLFGAGIFVAHVVEAHLRAGDWLGRVRSVRSMYRQAS